MKTPLLYNHNYSQECPLANRSGLKKLIGKSRTVHFSYMKYLKKRKKIEYKNIFNTDNFEEAYKKALEHTNKYNIYILFDHQVKEEECVCIVYNQDIGVKKWMVFLQCEVVKPYRNRDINQNSLLLQGCCDSTCIICGNEIKQYDEEIGSSRSSCMKPLVFELRENEYRAEGVCGKCAEKYHISNSIYADTLENLIKIVRARLIIEEEIQI